MNSKAEQYGRRQTHTKSRTISSFHIATTNQRVKMEKRKRDKKMAHDNLHRKKRILPRERRQCR